MASLAVRNAVLTDWPRLTPTVRFVATENRDLPRNPPLPLPDVWGTVGFQASARRMVTMGATPWVEETGVANIVICARSGHGDQPGVAAATDVMHAWDGWQDATGDIWFENVGPPRLLELEAEGEWILYGVACTYRCQEQVTLP